MSEEPKPPLIRCDLHGCSRGTKGGKNFCVEHVMSRPYAANLERLMRGGYDFSETADPVCTEPGSGPVER